MNYKAPRGTHDLWGDQARKMHLLEEMSRRVFEQYGFGEIRTPLFEDAGLFVRSIGETTDIVEKEMYVFEDRKGRKLALRPEGTASVVRAYLENGLAQQMPLGKFFYTGSMFRYERPQAGRYREFFQIGAEYFGDPSPSADAETILMTWDILRAAGLLEMEVRLHTLGCPKCRPAFRSALTGYFGAQENLCEDCRHRVEKNPLRVLDCKVDGARFENLPRMTEFLCEECRSHFCRVQELLTAAGCPFIIDHRLVRGLDYYTKTIFEVRSKALGSQDALAAGGRYDNLVGELGGPQTPAVGFALGSERVLMAAEKLAATPLAAGRPRVVFIAVAGQGLEKEAFTLARRLRTAEPGTIPWLKDAAAPGRVVSVQGPFADRSLKSQFRLADRLGAFCTVVFGEEEWKRGAVIVRDMQTQTQQEVNVETLR
ncbi:MAG: histidine--tRNA ligase [Endomicrobiales bacterium]